MKYFRGIYSLSKLVKKKLILSNFHLYILGVLFFFTQCMQIFTRSLLRLLADFYLQKLRFLKISDFLFLL